jgi:hypothetical protein
MSPINGFRVFTESPSYAGKLARIYGPDVRFDVVCLPDPFFDDPVWYVLGSGTVAGKSFAEYAAPPREYHLEAEDEQGSEICPIWKFARRTRR